MGNRKFATDFFNQAVSAVNDVNNFSVPRA